MAYAHTACYHYIYRFANCSGSSYTLSSTSLIKNSCTHDNLTNRPQSICYVRLQLYANTNILMPPVPVRVAMADMAHHVLLSRDAYA